ncbi:MAG: Gfo/Idh/MocA family oxidoreductase [Lentisphaeria bacterium]|nr:Gfo/Idh/MocA family oxidoreductase [Lentisphaeria bacterium]NQZ70367.1 Gfo/Idh/MocA family oxidoreductase [Lentisphaeria bacterium]
MENLKVGQVGVANFGSHRRKEMGVAGCFEILALCDRNEAALKQATEEEAAEAYTDFDAMLEHPGLEAIVISTGADSHAPFAIAAMKKGLHVFIEKPLCCNMEEIEALRQVSSDTGRIVGVGHSYCNSNAQLMLAKDYIENDTLGTIVSFEYNSSHSGGLVIQSGDWRGMKDRNPGGMLFQCGVHALHDLAFLFGPASSLNAMMRYDAHSGTETADAANVLLGYDSGLVGTLSCYHITGYNHSFRIFGTKGNLYMNTHTKETLFQERKENEVETPVPVELPKLANTNSHDNLLSWFDGIRKGTTVYPGLEDGINAVLPVFAAEESDNSGQRINL